MRGGFIGLLKTIVCIFAFSAVFTSCAFFDNNGGPAGKQSSGRDLQKDGLPPYNSQIAEMGNIELKVWMAEDYYSQNPVTDLVSEFSRTYPNIRINLQGIVWEEMDERVKTAVYQGDPPDIAHFHAYFEAAEGLAQPVDDLWEKWGREKDFLPSSIKDVEYKGEKYGMPLDINSLMLYYNKSIFKRAGLEFPGDDYTFDKLQRDAIEIVKSNSAKYGLATSSSGWMTYGLLKANGVSFYRDGKAEFVFDSQPVKEIFNFLHDATYVYKYASMPPLTVRQSDTPVALFQNGDAAMFFSGPWELARLRNTGKSVDESSIGVALLPTGSSNSSGIHYSVQGGGSLFIPKGAGNREAAFEFMKWFISDKYAMRMAKEMGRHPVIKKLYEDEFYNTEIMKTFIRQLENAEPMFPVYSQRINKAWNDAIIDIYKGRDVDEILKGLQSDVDKIIRLEGIE